MHLSATSARVKNQFFASLERFRRPAFAGWTWLETEVRNLTAVSSSAGPPMPAVTLKAFTTNPILPPLS
jgi:hypothetical protein